MKGRIYRAYTDYFGYKWPAFAQITEDQPFWLYDHMGYQNADEEEHRLDFTEIEIDVPSPLDFEGCIDIDGSIYDINKCLCSPYAKVMPKKSVIKMPYKKNGKRKYIELRYEIDM